MDPTQISFHLDGSCRLVDHLERETFDWSSSTALATDWLSDWRAGEYGPACDVIDTACDGPVPGVVDALVVLAEVADRDADEAGWVGAGPLEDLLSHSGNGLRVLHEVASAALQHPAFRKALDFAILPREVEAGLAQLGVHVRLAQRPTSTEKPPR